MGGVVGLAPHVLHHVGLLSGTALVAASGGTALFGAVGLAATTPLLLRLHRPFRTWLAPTIALVMFAVMFAPSAFVLGPAIRDSGGRRRPPLPSTTTATTRRSSPPHRERS